MEGQNMNFRIIICIIYLFVNWTRGEAIQGENVRDAKENEFPFVVALIGKKNETEYEPLNNRQFCTGSLITKKHVLTAEHCLLKRHVDEVEVLVGSTFLDKCKAYDPEKWITWQEWKYNSSTMFPVKYHDVAVITLKKCVIESNVSPARLSKSEPTKFFGRNVQMAGWGFTNRVTKPKILETADLEVLSNADCQFLLSQTTQQNVSITIQHMCAKSDPWILGGCGDSGGPLIFKAQKIIGVLVGNCPDNANVPKDDSGKAVIRLLRRKVNLYSSLHYYRDFILSFTNVSYRCNVMK